MAIGRSREVELTAFVILPLPGTSMDWPDTCRLTQPWPHPCRQSCSLIVIGACPSSQRAKSIRSIPGNGAVFRYGRDASLGRLFETFPNAQDQQDWKDLWIFLENFPVWLAPSSRAHQLSSSQPPCQPAVDSFSYPCQTETGNLFLFPAIMKFVRETLTT